MVLSVLMRIQWGMGRFCRIFLASFFLILKVLCEGYQKQHTINTTESKLLVIKEPIKHQ